MGKAIWRITSPDGVTVEIAGTSALVALASFLTEGLNSGHKAVRALPGPGGGLVFRDRFDQQICAGEWSICQAATNGGAAMMVVTIPLPPDKG